MERIETPGGKATADRVAQALGSLLGLRLHKVMFFASVRSFQFTSRQPTEENLEEPGQVAIHVDCPWRIEKNFQVITGCQDSVVDENGSLLTPENQTKDKQSLEQAIWNRLFADPVPLGMRNHTSDFVVERVEGDEFGGAGIWLTGGYSLRLFPCGTALESWRIFRIGDLESHFVVPPARVET